MFETDEFSAYCELDSQFDSYLPDDLVEAFVRSLDMHRPRHCIKMRTIYADELEDLLGQLNDEIDNLFEMREKIEEDIKTQAAARQDAGIQRILELCHTGK